MTLVEPESGHIEFATANIDVPEASSNVTIEVIRRGGQGFGFPSVAVATAGNAANGSDFSLAPSGVTAKRCGVVALTAHIRDDDGSLFADGFE
ncbi:MAG: hypothetical protein IPG63_00205 [Xanthomonadales bacterium]|nr:hypothetical protein [Xanthomonadales bacterium]MBK7146588.1 hypothetical protein [Xanthomonadales bacterium]MCC6560458.1 hypothetical protein [Xanthomonadales bacterium]